MGKLKAVTVLMAVAWLVGLVGVTAGDSTGTLERGWWAKPRVGVPTAEKVKVPPNPAAVAAKARLDSASAKRWHVEWGKATGLPMGVSGESKQYAGSPAEIARQFMEDYRPVFTGVAKENDPGDIAYVFDTMWHRAYPTRPVTVVKFTEIYKGVPVHLGSAAIHVSPQGRVIWAGGTLYRIDSLDVTPTLSADAVVPLLRQALLPDSMVCYRPSELVVMPGRPARLAYCMFVEVIVGGHPFPNEFFVDAQTADVLLVLNSFTGGPISFPPDRTDPAANTDSSRIKGNSEGHDYLGRIPVLQLSPRDTGSGRDTAPPRAPKLIPDSAIAPNPRPYRSDAAIRQRKHDLLFPHTKSEQPGAPQLPVGKLDEDILPHSA